MHDDERRTACIKNTPEVLFSKFNTNFEFTDRARARLQIRMQPVRSRAGAAVQRLNAGGAVAFGNDAGQVVVLEPLPYGLKARHQRVSPNGHGVRLGWCPVVSRAIAP